LTFNHSFEFGAFMDAARAETPEKRYDWRASLKEDKKFSGPPLPEALELARLGWPEGLEAMRRTLGALSVTVAGVVGPVFRCRSAMAGRRVNVAAVLAGRPDTFWRREYLKAPGVRYCKIGLGLGYPWTMEQETIQRRGAAVALLVDAVEAAGVSVDLVGTLDRSNAAPSQKTAGDVARVAVTIKRAGEYLDLDRLGFMVAHRSFFRRLGFSVYEGFPRKERDKIGFTARGSYAYNHDDAEGFDFYFPSLCNETVTDFSSDDAAAAWVRRTIAEIENKLKGVS